MARTPSRNPVREPKAWPWTHAQSSRPTPSSQVLLLKYTNFERISRRARETSVKHPPGLTPYGEQPLTMH